MSRHVPPLKNQTVYVPSGGNADPSAIDGCLPLREIIVSKAKHVWKIACKYAYGLDLAGQRRPNVESKRVLIRLVVNDER
jgi:hypothetical protein